MVLKKKLLIIYRTLLRKVTLILRNGMDRFFYISFKKGIPKIHINDRFEIEVKWTLRILTCIGLLSTVFVFSLWYLNLAFALVLLAVEQLLEKSIFVYFSFYLSAIPKYEKEDWKGMVWVISANPKERYFEVGILFSSREAAERIFPVIKHWCKTGNLDNTNLVQVSAVINTDSDEYHVYIYQNTEKDPDYILWKKKIDSSQPTKEHRSNVMQIMLCKGFRYSDSFFPKFREQYKNGEPFNLVAYVLENNKPVKLTHLEYIRKNELKIILVKDLLKKDKEYEHYRFVVDLVEDRGPEPPPSMEFIASRKN